MNIDIPTIADIPSTETDRVAWGVLTSRVLELAPLYITGKLTLTALADKVGSSTVGVTDILYRHDLTKERAVMVHAHMWTRSTPYSLWVIAKEVKGVTEEYVAAVFKKYNVKHYSSHIRHQSNRIPHTRTKHKRIRAMGRLYQLGIFTIDDVIKATGAKRSNVTVTLCRYGFSRNNTLAERVNKLVDMGWSFDRAISANQTTIDKYLKSIK
jgi:hypothetical protein